MAGFSCNKISINTSKTKKDNMKMLSRIPLELIFWVTALVLLGIAEPEQHGHVHHFTLCPLANLGIDWCPGCGVGRAITQALHGNLAESFGQHWFGIPALLIILYRIVVLLKLSLKRNKVFKLKYKEKEYV
jgi:hypothetical protein